MSRRADAARAAWPRLTHPGAGLLVLLAAAACIGPRPADARRIFVPREHRTVQGAIDAASPGDTIWVAAGVYRGPIRIMKSVIVFGDGGPDSTILDGGDSVRVVHVEGVRAGHLLGFTIRGGKAPGGGGVYCLRDTSFNISSCRIEKNWESGISAWQCDGLGLMDLKVRENQGSGIALSFSRAYVQRCEFFGNAAPSGGGLSVENSMVTGGVRDCTFEKNRAEAGTGGGLFADSSDVSVIRSQFLENRASVAGGAVSMLGATEGRVMTSLFRENKAASAPGVNSDHSFIHVNSCVFDRNHAVAGSAAVQVLGRGVANVNPEITDNTFYKNSCEGEGAAIFCQNASPGIRKNIFVVEGAVKAVIGYDSAPVYDCNLIHDPSGAAIGSLPSPNTLVGDPRFCDAEKGDFRVRDLSPAFLAPCGPIGAMKKPCSSFQVVPAR